ncbi:hypothetical protein HYH03_010639 [Edaphochlamys debaryana]|uniref:Uncharacterized protein n=1 Tax=Edaphochlamys debaryana TaxID=47281 RepID=A0A836BWG8_9CHLO|nr:hypothetical protein HYH03_010639 [Edaphochlamys debaryana]|eukprot:KAG2490962.1 hypothetical protein HYH03_010639 [Edaphochlamys debaryana]
MAASVSRRIRFRLDDGSVIGDSSVLGLDGTGVVRVPVEKGVVDRGIVSEREYERLQRLLSNPELPALPHANGYDGPPSKKARLDSRPSMSLAGLDWQVKCRELIENVRKGLKGDVAWFRDRVDEKLAPDYYTIVKHPMWINLVVDKLETGQYPSAQEFYDDVKLIWSNCALYNPVGNPVRIISEKADKRFENDWSNSGLAAERTKRATAGVAAPKYDPDFEAPPPKAATRAAPTKSAGNAAAPAPKKPAPAAPASAPRAANGGRAYSHEVTSGGKGREKALSLDRRNQIATELQNALSELVEDQLNELMALLPPEAMQPDESGEMELDFEALDDSNLRKLEAWLRNVRGQGPVSPSHISHNPSVRLEAGDAEDEDYHSD